MAATARGEAQLKRDAAKRLAEAKDPVEKLRLQCLARGAAGIKGLGRTFKIFDDDGNNQLSYSEFLKGLNDYGIYLDSDDEYRQVFQRFDKNGDGTLSFDEFLKELRPPMSQTRIRMVRQAFQKMDKDGNGTLTIADLKGVYDVTKSQDYISGRKDEDELLGEFLASFDTPGRSDGKVEWDEFLSYYSGVSASIDSDAYFVLMMTQAWKL